MKHRGEAVATRAAPRPWRDRSLWRDAALGLAITIAAMLAVLTRTDLKTRGTAAFADPGWDRHLYIEMARRDIFDFKLAPYCWRVLLPAVASLWPGGLQAGFIAVTVASLAVAGTAFFLLVRDTGFSKVHAGLAVPLLYALGWGPKFALADFWVPDGAVLAFVIVAMLFAWRDEPLALAFTLAVGVLAKESVIFAGPLLYTLHARRWLDWARLRTTVAALLPAVIVLVLVRIVVTPENGDSSYIQQLPPVIARFPELFPSYNYPDLFRTIAIDQRWDHRTWSDLDRYFTDALGVLPLLLAIVGGARRPGLAMRLSPFMVLVYAQLLFATDTQRLIVLAAPAVLWLGMEGMDALCGRLRLPIGAFALVVGPACVPVLLDPGRYDRPFLLDVVLVAAGFAALALFSARRPAAREDVPAPDPV